MVLDEITAFLDLPGRVDMMSLLRRHARQTGAVVLMSSHDLELSLEFADDLWVVDHGALYCGPPKDRAMMELIARSFASDGVQFDAGTGRFVLA